MGARFHARAPSIMREAGDPRLGTVLNGTYRLEAVIGSGGMGTVYLAHHVHLGTECAVKSLVPQFMSNVEAVKRFQREALISSQLGHPNIVRVTDFNYDADGSPFMVMEYLRGETLRTRMMRLGPLSLPQLLPMARQLCDGLDAAHARGVVHRDLKPENLFLCERSDQLKILDFGVSKVRDNKTQLTKPLSMIGTPYYMSPEQATGNIAEVDALSDVWAVGAILFEVLTGRGAFAADNPVAVFYKIVNEPFPSASGHGAAVSRTVDRVLAKACSRPASARYATTGELFQDLARAALIVETPRVGVVPMPAQPLASDATRLITPLALQAGRPFGAAQDRPSRAVEPKTELLRPITTPPETRAPTRPAPEPQTRLIRVTTPAPVTPPGKDISNEATSLAHAPARPAPTGKPGGFEENEKTDLKIGASPAVRPVEE
ncbi:MAG: serine/threonine protein kinase, partial [Myxococcales bacterium]|nr:serine/threonine protein kinase [Myxococcales bacterium]